MKFAAFFIAICFHGRKINLSHVFAGQNVGVTRWATTSRS
jgi:hypothetical protein